MNRKVFALLITFSFPFFIQSCKKDIKQTNLAPTTNSSNDEISLAQRSFAKILSKAIEAEPVLRIFLKKESLKQFDKDYDILYQIVKNEKIDGNESVHDKLVKYAESDAYLTQLENKLPLLTIFIPTLPNFSPESWNANTEIPLVASADRKSIQTYIYDHKGGEISLQPDEIPGFPILVVKQNERVVVNTKNNSQKAISANSLSSNKSSLYSNENLTFSFTDQVFDNLSKNSNAANIRVNRQTDANGIDPINIAAFNSGNEWQRDYVYYGLTPTNTKGAFSNKFSEFITSFKFLTPDALGFIADQDEDPKANSQYDPYGKWKPALPKTMWTEGSFEFSITVLLNAKNGSGTQTTKMMGARPDELFTLGYTDVGPKVGSIILVHLYKLTSITPKEFHPNIELVPWDLENYGTAWKFIVYEVDNAQETTRTEENTTTYAMNFGIEDQISKKIGLKFGASLTTSQKSTYTVKTTLNSDFLGEAILTFDQPIITGFINNNYSTREITTGNLLSMSIEPKRIAIN